MSNCTCTPCPECSRKKSINKARAATNDALFQAGKTYYDTYGAAVNAMDRALVENGWDVENFSGTLQSSSVHFHQEIGDGLWLTASLYRMDSGRWELVAYVN